VTTTSTEPPWVEAARARKAAQLVDVLLQIGATADDVAAFTDADRRTTEAQARTRPGSPKTWAMVAEMLAGSARKRAWCPFCGLGNPDGEYGPPLPVGHKGPCRR
jgi:hypothetical protein